MAIMAIRAPITTLSSCVGSANNRTAVTSVNRTPVNATARFSSRSRSSVTSSSTPASSFLCSRSSLLHLKIPACQGVNPSQQRAQQQGLCIRMQAGRSTPEAAERIIASLGYLLPLCDGAKYGRYLFQQFPITFNLVKPVAPLIQAYTTIPYAAAVIFFALYLGVIQNQKFSRYVRYNCMQAVILDILMIIPSLLERLLAPSGGIGMDIVILFYNTTFIYVFASFVFGVGSCLLGRMPRLPLVAEAADAQVPF